jgi:hypothetical protein
VKLFHQSHGVATLFARFRGKAERAALTVGPEPLVWDKWDTRLGAIQTLAVLDLAHVERSSRDLHRALVIAVTVMLMLV